MRIGIDARFYGSLGKGLGRYTEKLIKYLEIIDRENEYFIFLYRENFSEYIPQNENFHKILAPYRWYSWQEQLFWPRLLYKFKLDLVHFPHFNVPILYRKKFVVTIHDLILIHFPTLKNTTLIPLYYWIKFWAYRWVIGSAVRRASNIITVSEFTKNDLLKHYQISKDKILVTYEAADDFICPSREKYQSSESILKKYGIIKPYLVYVGNAYPHKNLERLLLAFKKVLKSHSQWHLVMIGKEDYFYRRIKDIACKESISNVIFPGFVSDDDLPAIYFNASAYVFPSLYEGFGLPPLEAMRCGVPVLASNHECLREILGEAAMYVEAEKIDNLAEKIGEIMINFQERNRLVTAGFQQIEKYHWQEMAEQTKAIYQKAGKPV